VSPGAVLVEADETSPDPVPVGGGVDLVSAQRDPGRGPAPDAVRHHPGQVDRTVTWRGLSVQAGQHEQVIDQQPQPPINPDMTFRIAGLVNPAVIVPHNATVRVEFLNADHDQAHGWVIGRVQQPFPFRMTAPAAFLGASAAVIGDPTAAGPGATIITFTAGEKGVYQYFCPMPGHAQMGMHGTFAVR
jgi:FtsP/CotA-like multicopper oxidase with cupredoxin domain